MKDTTSFYCGTLIGALSGRARRQAESWHRESGASRNTQKMADKVAKADPELAKKVAQGEVSLPKAAEQVGAKKPRKKKAAPPAAPAPADSSEADALRDRPAHRVLADCFQPRGHHRRRCGDGCACHQDRAQLPHAVRGESGLADAATLSQLMCLGRRPINEVARHRGMDM